MMSWILRNTLQWNFSQKSIFLVQENAFENVYEMAAILLSGRWVNSFAYVVS